MVCEPLFLHGAERRRYRRLATAAGRTPPPAAPPANVRRALADARGPARSAHTRPGEVAPAAFAPPARRKKALATGATGLCTPSPKKEKHRRSLRRTVASVAGSLARPSVCWSPETYPCCRWFRDPASPPLCVATGRQCFAAQTNRHNSRASAGTTEKQPKADRAGRDTNARTSVLFLSCPEAQKLRFQGAGHSAALRGPFPPKPKRTKLCRAAPCRAHRLDRAPGSLGAATGPPKLGPGLPPARWEAGGAAAARPAAALPRTPPGNPPRFCQSSVSFF